MVLTKNKVNPDLQKERDRCSFNVTELTNIIDGGADKTDERKKRGKDLSLELIRSSNYIQIKSFT